MNDLQKTCFEILELFSIQIQGKNLQSKFEMTDFTPNDLYFDKEKYQQVLINIVQNAIKFTQQGGFEIILEFKPSYECYGDMPCGTLVTMVKDSGCGMQEETKKRLFQIFGNIKRVNEGEQGVIRTQGIGLGLSICKELVQFLGGWIKCESEIDMGSQFSFGIKTMCEECR